MIHVETAVEAPWTETGWDALATRAVTAALSVTPYGAILTAGYAAEVSVLLTSDEQVRTLNREYRQKDKATNVLSFPMVQADMLEGLANSDDGEVLLGDIVLAHGVCTAEAAEKGVTVENHATHLIVHGLLHLLGYDHELGEAEADHMEELERAALGSLGIADPYIVRED